MPNVTIAGAGGGAGLTIPVTSQQAAQVAAQAMAAIRASMLAGKSATFASFAPGTLDIAAGATSLTAIEDASTAPLTVVDASGGALSVLSGLGGLTYTAAGVPVTDVLIDAGGGPSTITLARGTATVVADGAATVNAIQGGDLVYATGGGAASVNAGAGAVVYVAGTDTVGFYGPNARVYAQSGADLMVVGQGGTVTAADAGTVTISALGSLSGYTYRGLGGSIAVDATAKNHNGTGNSGLIVIDPRSADVTVFAGAGSETLFGAGDAGGSAANDGSDLVLSGRGFFHGGTGLVGGGLNILETSSVAGAATLVGGATVAGGADELFAQGADDVLIGGIETRFIDASGGSGGAAAIPGLAFQPVAATAGGDLLNAGAARQVSIYGAAGGANTIVSGIGDAFATGGHGGAGGNTYVDGEGRSGLAGGSILVSDFLVGTDRFLLNGATVSTPAAGGSTVTLSDGTRVTLANVAITTANQGSIFS